MEYNFTYETTFTDDFFFQYINDRTFAYGVVGIKVKDHKYVTITADRELTLSEQSDLNQVIQDYSDFNQTVINEHILGRCKAWGRNLINEFELKNMVRKDQGLMARQELDDIMKETHDKFIFICLLEGSLDSLHGKLYGYPEQTIGDKTWAARPAEVFTSIWQEDIDWIKSELNTFLGSL